jgi:hypothetical protein
MTVSTFTMQNVVDGVLNELRFAPGRDVQIHLQSSIVQDASILYRTLMMRYIFKDFVYMTQQTIDSTTGQPTTVNPYLDRYSNLLQVYKDQESQPLPFAPALVNPSRYNRPCVARVSTDKVFRIWPARSMTVYVWSRNFKDKDFELTDVIPFYMDLLVIGTALALCTKAGINQELSGMLGQQFQELLDAYREQEIEPQYQVNQTQGAIPMEWYSHDN